MKQKNLVYAAISLIVLLVIGAGYLFFSAKNSVPSLPVFLTPTPSQQLIGGQKDSHGCLIAAGYSWCQAKDKCLRPWEEPCTATPTATLTPVFQNSTQVTPTPAVSGGPSGYISCTNEIPPDPSNNGTAIITSNWNNLVLGVNGTAKAAVCVSVGGKSSLVSIDNSANGTRTTNVNWIILNATYTFTLYDDHGGDLPDCGGAVLSSCLISNIAHPAK